eukprot:scaffold1696_cov258-Pinguiococcus_pyrenoidosus.AAC.1
MACGFRRATHTKRFRSRIHCAGSSATLRVEAQEAAAQTNTLPNAPPPQTEEERLRTCCAESYAACCIIVTRYRVRGLRCDVRNALARKKATEWTETRANNA